MKKLIAFFLILLAVTNNKAQSQTCDICIGNLVSNPGFENGISNWTVSGGTLTAGNTPSCQLFSGDFGVSNSSNNMVSQVIATNLLPGTVINASVYAGIKSSATTHKTGIYFYDSNMVVISKSEIVINKLLSAAPAGLSYYNWTGTVPAGVKYTGIGFTATGDTIKTDQWCVKVADAGFGLIGGKLWNDANADGIQDVSEVKRIANVTVSLKNAGGTIIATTTTNQNGNYNFSGLSDGSYKVKFPVTVTNFEIAPSNAGTNDSTDSDADKVTGETDLIPVVSGGSQIFTTVDAGYLPTNMQIGNRIWYDADNNGIINSENGIYNVTVNLYRDNNNDNVPDSLPMATTVTDGTGLYNFFNLKPGNYIVGAVIPNNMKSSDVNGGDPDNNINSDDNGQVISGNEIRGLAMTLIGGTEPTGTENNNNQTYDFGFVAVSASLLTLGNDIFIDYNGNGIKDGADYAYSSSSFYVNLYADNNDDGIADSTAPAATTATNAAGNYMFYALNPGKYFVQITNTPSWMTLIQYNGGDPDNDIDNDNNGISQNIAAGTIKGGTITLTANGEPGASNTNNTYDFAVYKGNGLGDFVFADANANGIQDAGEAGIPNVTINLRSTTGTLLATTTTDATGKYYFYDASQYNSSFTYNIEFVTPAGYVPSPSNSGPDDNKDSDPVNGIIAGATVPDRTWDYSFDAGFVPAGSIGDYVWQDVNKNGLQDGGEPFLTGKTVILKDGNGVTLAINITDSAGKYYFGNLPAGNYQVVFGGVSGMYLAAANVGGLTAANNSKPNQVSGIALVTLGIGENNTIIDAGFSSGVLPVKEIILNPVLKGPEITVNWRTINEINTSYFEVERSYGDNHFETIDRLYTLMPLGGNGNYKVTDRNFSTDKPVIMYRIKSVDIDGKESYSSIATVRINHKPEITTWPNPFVSSLNLSYTALAKSVVTVTVVNAEGKKVIQTDHPVVKGLNQFSVQNLGSLKSGMYLLLIYDKATGETQTVRVFK